jgi:hypothetical protein
VSGSSAGLGNEDVGIELTARGTAIVDYRNPGGNIAPGQRTAVNVVGAQLITDVKTGRVNFNITTAEPEAPQDACHRKWTAMLRDVDCTNAKLEVFQGGTVVLTAEVL